MSTYLLADYLIYINSHSILNSYTFLSIINTQTIVVTINDENPMHAQTRWKRKRPGYTPGLKKALNCLQGRTKEANCLVSRTRINGDKPAYCFSRVAAHFILLTGPQGRVELQHAVIVPMNASYSIIQSKMIACKTRSNRSITHRSLGCNQRKSTIGT